MFLNMQCRRTCDTTDMYFYLGRAGLVCLLALLVTLSLPARAQIPQPGDMFHRKPGDVGPDGSKVSPKSSSEEPPSVTSTRQATSTEGEGDNESTATTVAVSPSEGKSEGGSSNGEGAAAKKEAMEEGLYFQVRERISKRNLTLGDIEDVLRQKNDDGSQFLFSLADKLGYIVDDKFDDPHIPVIKSHRKKLVTRLEARKKFLMASSQHKPKPVPAIHASDEPPQVISEPASDSINKVPVGSDVSKGGSSNGKEAAAKKEDEEFLFFQVRKSISRRNLNLGDIEEVLSQKDDDGRQFLFSLADKLGYIVNDKFDDPHIPVIKSHREKLVTLLEAMKKSLMASSQHKPKPVPAVHASDEPPQVSSEPAPDKDIHRVGFEVSKAIRSFGPEAINRLLNDFSLPGTLGYAVGQELGYSNHDVHMEYLEKLKDDEVVASLQRILKSKLPNHPGNGEPSAPSPSPPTQRTPPSREDVGDSESEDDNEGSQLPSDLTDDGQSYKYDDDDDDDLHGGFLSGIDEEKRMKLVQNEGFQNYLATKYNELYEQFFEDRADPDKLGAVLEEYIEWKSGWSEIAVNEKGGGGSDGKIKPEPKQGETVWIVHVPRP